MRGISKALPSPKVETEASGLARSIISALTNEMSGVLRNSDRGAGVRIYGLFPGLSVDMLHNFHAHPQGDAARGRYQLA
jgi:hypothetical protein